MIIYTTCLPYTWHIENCHYYFISSNSVTVHLPIIEDNMSSKTQNSQRQETLLLSSSSLNLADQQHHWKLFKLQMFGCHPKLVTL